MYKLQHKRFIGDFFMKSKIPDPFKIAPPLVNYESFQVFVQEGIIMVDRTYLRLTFHDDYYTESRGLGKPYRNLIVI